MLETLGLDLRLTDLGRRCPLVALYVDVVASIVGLTEALGFGTTFGHACTARLNFGVGVRVVIVLKCSKLLPLCLADRRLFLSCELFKGDDSKLRGMGFA